MPWMTNDVDKFVKGLSRKEKRKWVSIANSALESCIDGGGSDETCAPKAIQTASGVIKKDRESYKKEKYMSVKQAEATKILRGKEYPASSFLVVEDPEAPSTWHLPYKSPDGTPDHRLCGAAWAALFNPNGYRGQKYAGPGKEEAKKKLKAVYDKEGWEMPMMEAQVERVEEYDMMGTSCYVPYSVVSFDQLDQLEQAQEITEEIQELTAVYIQIIQNIIGIFEGDKVVQIKSASEEYANRLDDILNPTGEEGTTGELEAEQDSDSMTESLRESEAGGAISLEEGESSADNVLRMDVRIIRPGWGNKADNHYYSSDMLRQYAHNFEGAKMYETDHRPEQKSTRTWVSTITEIRGFDNDGSPIGRVVVHDPDFMERVRNLNSAGLLDRLECSIYANGKASPGFELEGRKGKQVLEITEVESVDWVTKAGAGGKALSLAESHDGGTMTEEQKLKESPDTIDAVKIKEEEQQQAVSGNDEPQIPGEVPEASPTPAPEDTQNTQVPAEQISAPVTLTADAVRSLLDASNLPEVAKVRLQVGEYLSEAEVITAIEGEKTYLAEVLKAGKVSGMGMPDKANAVTAEAEQARASAAERVNKKYFGG